MPACRISNPDQLELKKKRKKKLFVMRSLDAKFGQNGKTENYYFQAVAHFLVTEGHHCL